ncbi:MAG: preprotein translocase subunit SecG [Candidatus Azotimanducaceae bacterium]|jgi:preprotein translocase subunit SecG
MQPEIIETLVLVLHVLASLAIIGLILIQQGKGAEMGSGFGSGSSSTVFGSGGAGNFLTKTTTTIAIAFFLTSFGLAFFAKQKSESVRTLGIPAVVQQAEAVELPSLNIDAEAVESELPVVEESTTDNTISSDIPQG